MTLKDPATAQSVKMTPKLQHPIDSGAVSISGSALDDRNLLSGNYWGELRTLLAVAKAKSLTRAAKYLNVSHMTVGRDIRRLNDVLGSQLVILSKAGAVLTPRGNDLVKLIVRFDQDLFAISNQLRSENKDSAGLVKIRGIIYFASTLDSAGLRGHAANCAIVGTGRRACLPEDFC